MRRIHPYIEPKLLAPREFPRLRDISDPPYVYAELSRFGRLSSDEYATDFGLTFSLDDGDASPLARAIERGLVFASDDRDAIGALNRISSDHPNQRIGKILIEAVSLEALTQSAANEIHAEMRLLRFWDIAPPFPDSSE